MFNVGKHAVFTLFALTLINKQSNADDVVDELLEIPKNVKTILVMDKLENFNMSYYCKFQANYRVCGNRSKSRKYFYDIKLQKCQQFEYGNCDHSYNMFEGRHLCLDTCRDEAFASISENVTANVYCRYQPDFGDCNSYEPSYYYDISERKCNGFSYSGCGGNRNRFTSMNLCLDICDSAVRDKEEVEV